MAVYRNGRKIPALPPPQRHAIAAVTVAAVFLLVGLTGLRPGLLAVPALLVIAVLGLVDYGIVMTRPEPGGGRRRSARPGPPVARRAVPAGPGTPGAVAPAKGRSALEEFLQSDPAAADSTYNRPPAVRPPLPELPGFDDVPSYEGYGADPDRGMPASLVPVPAAQVPPNPAPPPSRRRRRTEAPVYEQPVYSAKDDVLDWDTQHADEDLTLRTMAIDMRGFLDETGQVWIN